MNRYIINCTKSQAMKAFELGADLTPCVNAKKNFIFARSRFNPQWSEKYRIPTAEQMIGWLEEQEEISDIHVYKMITSWSFIVSSNGEYIVAQKKYPSRKEATLAAIDAALGYLINQKKLSKI